MLAEPINCRITEHGDSSVGIFDYTWVVPTPFFQDDIDAGVVTHDELENFKNSIRNLYAQYCVFDCSAIFEFGEISGF